MYTSQLAKLYMLSQHTAAQLLLAHMQQYTSPVAVDSGLKGQPCAKKCGEAQLNSPSSTVRRCTFNRAKSLRLLPAAGRLLVLAWRAACLTVIAVCRCPEGADPPHAHFCNHYVFILFVRDPQQRGEGPDHTRQLHNSQSAGGHYTLQHAATTAALSPPVETIYRAADPLLLPCTPLSTGS
jgi:hypothetical protein